MLAAFACASSTLVLARARCRRCHSLCSDDLGSALVRLNSSCTSQKETKQQRKDRKKAARKKAKEAARKQKQKECLDYFGRPSQAMTVYGSMKSVPLPKELLEEDQGGPTCRRSPMETEHVQKVYDTVAEQWHGTRYKAWPKVAEFVLRQRPGSVIGDLGCGNGKNLLACNKVGVGLGCDFSLGLLRVCRRVKMEVAAADSLWLPYRTSAFDAVLSIAVLHHISSVDRRVQLVKECMRVARVGGEGLFYAWAYEQHRVGAGTKSTSSGKSSGKSGHRFQQQDVFVPFHLRVDNINKRVDKAKSEGVEGSTSHAGVNTSRSNSSITPTNTNNTLFLSSNSKSERIAVEGERVRQKAAASHGVVNTSKGAVIFQRYCHVYREGELERLFLHPELSGWVRVDEVYFDTGNWCVRATKIKEHDASPL